MLKSTLFLYSIFLITVYEHKTLTVYMSTTKNKQNALKTAMVFTFTFTKWGGGIGVQLGRLQYVRNFNLLQYNVIYVNYIFCVFKQFYNNYICLRSNRDENLLWIHRILQINSLLIRRRILYIDSTQRYPIKIKRRGGGLINN